MKNVAATLLCLGLGFGYGGCSTSTPPTLKPLPPPDMTMKVVDMAEPDMTQETCGAIVSCIIAQGSSNPLGCFGNVGAMGGGEALQLLGCAAQNCLGGDGGAGLGGLTGGGGGNPLGLFQCLSMNCKMQLSNCMGLPF